MNEDYFNFLNSIYSELLARNYQTVLFGNLEKFSELSNDQYIACCPFHEDCGRSFSIAADKPVWYCHECKEKGNWIQYIQKKEGLSYKLALSKLVEAVAIYTTTTLSA